MPVRWAVLWAFGLGCGHTNAGLPEGGREIHDVSYTSPSDTDRKHQLNLYLPAGSAEHAVLVFVHGGAWFFGDRDARWRIYSDLGRRFAAQGFLTIVPSYRLAPRYPHPAHIEDVAAVVAWTIAHAAEYGGDPNQLFVMGHSAGAHLVALLATDPQWLRAHETSPNVLRGVIGLSGPYDLRGLADQGFFARRVIERAFGSDPAIHRDASPIVHIADARPLPPFLLGVAEGDPDNLHEQADRFTRALLAQGGFVQRFVARDRDHFTEIIQIAASDDPVVGEVVRFMRAELH